MKTIEVTLQGVTPLMVCQFTDDKSATRSTLVEKPTAQEQAESCVYRSNGHFVFPGSSIARVLRDVAGNHKLKGARKSARYVVPAAVRVLTAWPVINDGNKPATAFSVDSRSAVIPSTKGRIMVHRPTFQPWTLSVRLTVNEALLPVAFVKQLLQEAGEQVGIGAFRPEKGGGFGTFIVTEWREIS